MVNPLEAFWKGRSVLLTGHTGFKGGWMALWLAQMGARVHGFALDPVTEPSFFNVSGVSDVLASDVRADLADRGALDHAIAQVQPSIVFHLAAQPLVRESYRQPVETFGANVMGTAHLLEAARMTPGIEAVVVITTDKVYHNPETSTPFHEDAPLGGEADPYSASKAAAEIAVASWRKSFFHDAGIPLATARAGNVIGGGDWAADRLVPDCLAAFSDERPVELRFPNAVRPWQHVIEPVAGYMILAEQLVTSDGPALARGWNYGPRRESEATVGIVAQKMAEFWGEGASVILPDGSAHHPHEAGLLRLDATAVEQATGWRPRWPLTETLARTIAWHRAWLAGEDMAAYTLADIDAWKTA